MFRPEEFALRKLPPDDSQFMLVGHANMVRIESDGDLAAVAV